jgi:hypothetical protein
MLFHITVELQQLERNTRMADSSFESVIGWEIFIDDGKNFGAPKQFTDQSHHYDHWSAVKVLN